MSRTRRAAGAVVACMILAFTGACGREEAVTPPAVPPAAAPPAAAPAAEAFRISRVDLGNAIDGNLRVPNPATVFAPNDTIYASVVSEGASPSVTLVARWTYEDGQPVSESSQTIAPTGAAATEFHIAKPDGWPAGKYQVEILANGESTGPRTFQVQ